MRVCEEAGCDKPHWARGYCTKHYSRYRRHGALPVNPPRPECFLCLTPVWVVYGTRGDERTHLQEAEWVRAGPGVNWICADCVDWAHRRLSDRVP